MKNLIEIKHILNLNFPTDFMPEFRILPLDVQQQLVVKMRQILVTIGADQQDQDGETTEEFTTRPHPLIHKLLWIENMKYGIAVSS